MDGIRHLLLEEQIEKYKEAIRLRQEHGWGKRRISKKLGVSENTVKGWLYYGYSTLNRFNNFEIKSCYDLGYILGTEKGDGNTFYDKTKGKYGGYMVSVTAKDTDFINEFNRCLCVLLNKNKPYAVTSQGKGRYRVECSCKELYDFLRQPLEEQKHFIEEDINAAVGFVRAFFDGEGGAYWYRTKNRGDYKVRCYNTDMGLLEYIKEILKLKFDINSNIAKLYDDGYTGSDGCIRKAHYQLNIGRRLDILKFHKHIGFSIKRKQDMLEEIVKYLEAKGYSV